MFYVDDDDDDDHDEVHVHVGFDVITNACYTVC